MNKYFKEVLLARKLKELLKQKIILRKVSGSFRKKFDDEKWLKESCPLCGGMAGLGFINGEGIRYLECVNCSMKWRFLRALCPFCLEESGKYDLFEIDDLTVRVDFCDSCRSYLKTIMINENSSSYELDFKTFGLDNWAINNGYIKKTASMIGINFFKEET